MNNFFDLIGRIFISSIFLFSGINKIFNFDNTIQWMESYGLNPASVIGLVSANNQLVNAGAIDTGAGRFVIKVPGVIESLEELSGLPIKIADGTTIHFSDIAIVRRTYTDSFSWSRVNGKSSIVLENQCWT